MTIPAVALALVFSLSTINIARAKVCFLPDSEDCEQVPYNEYEPEPCTGDDCPESEPDQCNSSDYCYATEEQARAARGTVVFASPRQAAVYTTEMDTYYLRGGCYCLKNVCGTIQYRSLSGLPSNQYSESGPLGAGWTCTPCQDGNSIRYNKYKCIKKECVAPATVSCMDGECTRCVPTGTFSGNNSCEQPENVTAYCPDGTSETKPSSGCYDKVDKTCGTEGAGGCYKAVETPDCSGEGKRLSNTDGVCSCVCKEGYNADGGNCVLNTCTTGTPETSCNPANSYTFTPNGTSFENTSGDTIRCGTCEPDKIDVNGNRDCATRAHWMFTESASDYHYVVSGAEDVTAQYKDEYGLEDEEYIYETCLNDTVTFSIEPTDCIEVEDGWVFDDNGVSISKDTSFTFTMTQDFINEHNLDTNGEDVNYVEFDFTNGCYNNTATIYCDYYEQTYLGTYNEPYADCHPYLQYNTSLGGYMIMDGSTGYNQQQALPCGVNYTVEGYTSWTDYKGNISGTTICGGVEQVNSSGELTSTTIQAGTYILSVDYSGYLGVSNDYNYWKRYAPDILVVYGENPINSFNCWEIGAKEWEKINDNPDGYDGNYCTRTIIGNMAGEMSNNHIDHNGRTDYTGFENTIFDNFVPPNEERLYNCHHDKPINHEEAISYEFEGGKTYYIRAGSLNFNLPNINNCWYKQNITH